MLNEFSGEKYLKHTNAMIGYRTQFNENLKKHIEKEHKKEKLLNTFVVPNVIQKSK